MTSLGGVASAERVARTERSAKTEAAARRAAVPKKARATTRARAKRASASASRLRKKVATARLRPEVRTARTTASSRQASTPKGNAKPRTTRFTIRNPGSLVWVYEGNSKGYPSKDARRKAHGLDPYATSQTLLETELQATLDLSKYDDAVKAIQEIAKDPKKSAALLGNKKGWSIEVKSQKEGTLKMTDFYADDPRTFALTKVGGSARWRSVQRLDPSGKPVDDRQQLNVKAGFRRLDNSVVVRVEQGTEVAGLVKNGRIKDPKLKKFLRNHRFEDNPTNLINQMIPGVDVVKLVDTPLVEVSQKRYKFHIRDASGADVGEGSIDVVEARPTPEARKFFGKQLKDSVRFGRIEYEGEHINPTLSQQQLAQASQSPRPHGAFDVYSNTITQSSDIKTLTGIAGRLTKALGATPHNGNKVLEAMTRLGFFDHLPKGVNSILEAQQKNQAKWMVKLKEANPGFVD